MRPGPLIATSTTSGAVNNSHHRHAATRSISKEPARCNKPPRQESRAVISRIASDAAGAAALNKSGPAIKSVPNIYRAGCSSAGNRR